MSLMWLEGLEKKEDVLLLFLFWWELEYCWFLEVGKVKKIVFVEGIKSL